MNFPLRSIAAMALATSTFAVQVPMAVAGSHFTPPGMGVCLNPPDCTAVTGGGPVVLPPPPPPPGGGGGGGLGPFGKGIVGGIGMGVGMGLVQGLTRPQQPQVIVQQPQPVYTQPVQSMPASGGLSPHDQFCLGKYKSYNIQTKQYLSYSGQYKYCQSPYM